MRMCFLRTKEGGIVLAFTDWRQLPTMTDAMQEAGYIYRGICVWDKTEATRPILGRFRSQAEYIVFGSVGAMPLIGKTAPGVFRCSTSTSGNDHQTAKPVPVMEWLLSIVPADSLVLDPFVGGGATIVACKRTGRPFIGFEMSPYWADYSRRRIGETDCSAGLELFEPEKEKAS
jgi:site-specific DNA-methyltransferase (adenine-specific)